MEKILMGLSVVTILLLLALLGAVRKLSSAKRDEKAAGYAAPVAPVAIGAGQGGVSPEVVAAITAAIASVWEGENGFAVRRIKRVNNAPAWNRAGREEQIFSRI